MAEQVVSWTCPYCKHIASITSSERSSDFHYFDHKNKLGPLGLWTKVIVCPNMKCREFVLTAALYPVVKHTSAGREFGPAIMEWNLKPNSEAKPFPDYIPEQIRQDYAEACLIRDLSPKASATLSRRCLQGMIRDFWDIKRDKLHLAIQDLKDKVDGTTWKAIDAVRSIGNIGAHMEKDIDLIIDVEPNEAKLLIGLIEQLMKEWYIHRHDREQDMAVLIAAAEGKKEMKGQGKAEKEATPSSGTILTSDKGSISD